MENDLGSILRQAGALQGPLEQVDHKLVELAVELARRMLAEARHRETDAETTSRLTLARLLESPHNQLFSTALTDRIHRTKTASRALHVLLDLSHRTGGGRDLPAFDRLQLRAARMFGAMVPKLTVSAVLHRLREEALPYLWDAEPNSLKALLEKRHEDGFSVNLNYLGEEVLGEEEAEARLRAYQEFVKRADIEAVSVKLSGIDPHLELLALEKTVARMSERVEKILDASLERPKEPALVYFDMEAYRDLPLTEALLSRLLYESAKGVKLGVAIQAYLPDSHGLVERLSEMSRRRVENGGAPLRVRLVKGANLQMEQVEASLHRLTLPIFPSKLEVDAHFKRVLRLLSEEAKREHVLIGVGSHNLFDIAYALLLREREGLGNRLRFEMLEGMAGKLGEVVRELTGELLLYAPAVLEENFAAAVSYLVRRLDENTAQENFLRDAPHMTPDGVSFEEQAARFSDSAKASWLDAPATLRTQDRSLRSKLSNEELTETLKQPFENAADTDFTRADNRKWIAAALSTMHSGQDVRVVPLLAGSGSGTRTTIAGFDPSRPEFTYPIELATGEEIRSAIAAAELGLTAWRSTTLTERAKLLLKVAELFEEHRGDLIAAMVLDGGKRVQEADIEVSEAVDFARFYAKSSMELEPELAPRGVIVVTPPWNFPLAIPLGGALGALVAGNTVILKPAPEAPWVSYLAASLCRQAGIPGSALQFLPCKDEDAEPLLVDPHVKAVVLTGATETAKLFLQKRPDLCLMAETGGKNGAYVSAVSDREQAIAHIVRSAFGHAGQKCSALSVLILEREVFEDDDFKRQLVDAARSLPVGPAWDARSFVTPLILPPSGHLRTILKKGAQYGTWLLEPVQDEHNPRLVSPGILWGVEPGSYPHLTEFFGPVLSVLCADNIEHGMTLLNTPAYGLTAGLFSLDEREHDLFVSRAQAGNLYINRGITGAVVGRQPFGGHKESCFGPGAKAGGPDYVRQMTRCLPLEKPEASLIASREESYDAAFQYYFRLHRGTRVVGEENYLRYLPGHTALVLGEGATAIDLRFSLATRKRSRADFPIFILAGAHAGRMAQLLGQERGDSEILSGEAIVQRAKELGVERLRLVGAPSSDFLEAAAKAKVTVLLDPVSEVGRQEVGYYLRSQSISFASHRHGNTSLSRLSRLRRTLDVWRSEPPRSKN